MGGLRSFANSQEKEEVRPKCIRSLSSVDFADDVFLLVLVATVIWPHVLCFLIPAVYKSVRSIGAGSRGHRLHREEFILGILAFSSGVIDCNVA